MTVGDEWEGDEGNDRCNEGDGVVKGIMCKRRRCVEGDGALN